MSFIAYPSIVVTAAQGEPPPPGVDEPVFDVGVHTSLYYENFQGYSSTADMKTQMRAVYADAVKDYQRGAVDLDLTGGYGGSKAVKFTWDLDAIYNAKADGEAWVGSPLPDPPSPNPTIHMTWLWRFLPVGCDPSGLSSGKKCMEIDESPNRWLTVFDRSTDWIYCPPNVTYEPGCGNKHDSEQGPTGWCHSRGPTGVFGHWGMNTVVDTPPPQTSHYHRAHKNIGLSCARLPYAYREQIYDGNWHRIAQTYVPSSGTAVGDGELYMWVDGYQIIDLDGKRVGTPEYGMVYMNTFAGRWNWIRYPTTYNGTRPNNPAIVSALDEEWYDEVRVFVATP